MKKVKWGWTFAKFQCSYAMAIKDVFWLSRRGSSEWDSVEKGKKIVHLPLLKTKRWQVTGTGSDRFLHRYRYGQSF